MRVKELICKVIMLLCMFGFFEVGISSKAYADEQKILDYPSLDKIVKVSGESDVTYKIFPETSGVYNMFLYAAEVGAGNRAAYATLYNSDMEFICDLTDISHYSSDGILVFLSGEKDYYMVVKKEATCEKLEAQVKISYKYYVNPNKRNGFYVSEKKSGDTVDGEYKDGLSYDKNTYTLELNNYNGDGEISIDSSWEFFVDEKDMVDFPTFNIKISGVNNVTYSEGPSILFNVKGHCNINVIGDGVLNVKFSVGDGHLLIQNGLLVSGGCDIIFDGPTINVESIDSHIITTSYDSDEIGKLTIKSGNICVNNFLNVGNYYFNAIVAGKIEMTGGRVLINYSGDSEITNYEKIIAIKCNDIENTDGKIIITGGDNVLTKLEPVYASEGRYDIIKDAVLKANNNISKIDVKLEKDVYKYDGKVKTPKVIIDKLEEGVDYTVTYVDNKKVGTAKVIIKGIGVFTGSKKVTFKIVKTINGKDIDDKTKNESANDIKGVSSITDGKLIYKVTKEGTLDGKTVGKVTVVGLKKKSLKKVSIKSVLTVNGVKYKVTAIGKKAFKNSNKIKSIVIGKNVSKISKGAFAGCKKLKSITIKSKKIKKFVKGTFKGVKKICVIKVPKAKKKVYAKKIKKAGFKGIVK